VNGWILGYLIGLVLVLVVVGVLLLMITGARRTAGRAEAVLAALHDARDGTEPLWQLAGTVATAERIVAAAAAAREKLTPEAPRG